MQTFVLIVYLTSFSGVEHPLVIPGYSSMQACEDAKPIVTATLREDYRAQARTRLVCIPGPLR